MCLRKNKSVCVREIEREREREIENKFPSMTYGVQLCVSMWGVRTRTCVREKERKRERERERGKEVDRSVVNRIIFEGCDYRKKVVQENLQRRCKIFGKKARLSHCRIFLLWGFGQLR